MKLRTEDALGYFSAQMLGRIALPHVTRDEQQQLRAVHRTRGLASGKMNRVPVDGTDSAPGPAPAADTKRDPAPTEEEEIWMCPGCRWADGHAYGCPHDDSVMKFDAGAMMELPLPGADPAPENDPRDPLDRVEDQFTERLGVCGCGAPLEAMRALRMILGRRHLHQHVEASDLPAEGLYMLALYLLDEKELIEHGSSLHACWLDQKGLELLAWLDAQHEVLTEPPRPPPPTKTCGTCTAVVPLGEWSYLYDSCSACAENAARTGDNWRDFVREQDRLRLIGEFTD